MIQPILDVALRLAGTCASSMVSFVITCLAFV